MPYIDGCGKVHPPKVWTSELFNYDGEKFFRVHWFDGESWFYGIANSEAKAARNLDWFLYTCDMW